MIVNWLDGAVFPMLTFGAVSMISKSGGCGYQSTLAQAYWKSTTTPTDLPPLTKVRNVGLDMPCSTQECGLYYVEKIFLKRNLWWFGRYINGVVGGSLSFPRSQYLMLYWDLTLMHSFF